MRLKTFFLEVAQNLTNIMHRTHDHSLAFKQLRLVLNLTMSFALTEGTESAFKLSNDHTKIRYSGLGLSKTNHRNIQYKLVKILHLDVSPNNRPLVKCNQP